MSEERDRQAVPPAPLDYEVIAVLWRLGSASSRELAARVDPTGDRREATEAAIARLHETGMISRQPRGESFVYAASCSRQDMERLRAQGRSVP